MNPNIPFGTVMLVCFAPMAGQARYLCSWAACSGSAFAAFLSVPDAAIADGVISVSEIEFPSGFMADTALSRFTDLAAGDRLLVDPDDGSLTHPTNHFAATKATDVLEVSSKSFLIPSSPLQLKGKGLWRVLHLSEPPPIYLLRLVGITNDQAQLQFVASGPDVTFAIQVSADLSSWTPIGTSQTAGGVGPFRDPEPVARTRSYRAWIAA